MEATFALFLDRRLEFTPTEVAWTFAYVGLLAAVSQGVLVGPLTRRLGEFPVLLVGLVTTGIGLVGLALVDGLPTLLIALAPLSLGSGLVFATTTRLISRRVDAADQGGALGVTASVGGLARIAGPLGATALFQSFDPGAPLLVGGAMFLVCALAAPFIVPQRTTAQAEVPLATQARDV